MVVVTCLWLVGVVQGFILGNLVYDCNIVVVCIGVVVDVTFIRLDVVV